MSSVPIQGALTPGFPAMTQPGVGTCSFRSSPVLMWVLGFWLRAAGIQLSTDPHIASNDRPLLSCDSVMLFNGILLIINLTFQIPNLRKKRANGCRKVLACWKKDTGLLLTTRRQSLFCRAQESFLVWSIFLELFYGGCFCKTALAPSTCLSFDLYGQVHCL